MDPLSVIASSLALTHAIHKSLKVYHSTRRALPELLALHNEIADIQLVLRQLEAELGSREASGNRVAPCVSLMQIISSSNAKLDLLAAEVESWESSRTSNEPTAESKKFRLFRIGQKAQAFREEMRNLKSSLAVNVMVLTA
jgi:hypothetical protein